MDIRKKLGQRVSNRRRKSLLDFNTTLQHFCIVSFKTSVDKLNSMLPDGLKSRVFEDDGEQFALISAVGFQDADFGFRALGNFPRFNFFQTNYRAYIVDENGIDCVWFFGTTLGSWTASIPRRIWKMPWTKGKYSFDYKLNDDCYSNYHLDFISNAGNGKIHVKSNNEDMKLHAGFNSLDEQLLILTHPIIGYYYRRDGRVGSYEIWHPEMRLHEGSAVDIKLDLFYDLGLVSQSEFNNPHSLLLTEFIEFDILMPPRIV